MARPRRILVTGGDGQLGIELQRALDVLGEVVVCRRGDCDLAVSASIRRKVREVGPDLACAVNTVAPLVLGEEASRLGALVVHYSSDYVFDGKKEGAYTEEDEPNPLGVYGRTKRDGERGLMASGARCVIFRTSWVCSTHGKNFVKTILRLASERPELKIVADQWGAPTGAAMLADASAHVASPSILSNSTEEKSGCPPYETLLRIYAFALPPATSLQSKSGEIVAWFPTGHRHRLLLVDPAKQEIAENFLVRPERDTDLSALFKAPAVNDTGYPEGACPL